MHVFQPYPMEMLDWNPMEKISKEWYALTTEVDGKVNAMTASWGAIGHIWGKNCVFVFIRDSRYTKELLDKSTNFSVCFFDPADKGLRSTLKYFGAVSGRNEDKIQQSRLTVNHINDTAIIDESNFVITCKKLSAIPFDESCMIDENLIPDFYKDGDYHTMYIGEITEILAR